MHDAMEDAKNSGIDITRYIQSLRPATITSLWRQPYSDAYCYGSKARQVFKDNGISINAAGSTEWFFLLKDIFRIFCDVYTSIIGRPSPSAHQSFTSLIIIYILSPNWTKIQSMLLKLTHLCLKPQSHIYPFDQKSVAWSCNKRLQHRMQVPSGLKYIFCRRVLKASREVNVRLSWALNVIHYLNTYSWTIDLWRQKPEGSGCSIINNSW